MPQNNTHEKQFLDALQDIFVGAKVEGESGYINLMKIKANYYSAGVFPQLSKDIDEACKPFESGFREELFDKLYDFFSRYFSESGSIYFRHTAPHHNVYERVYTDDRDVMLFWKTHMLYYVKTDRLFNSLEVEVDCERFFFDVSGLKHKQSNEKRDPVYSFARREKDGRLVFSVAYSEKGTKTKLDEVLGAIKQAAGSPLDEDTLQKAFRVFEKQSEVDYFINKNARAFLQEQFDLWMYQYIFKGESAFNVTRLKQLQAIRDIAFKIIDFIAQFEDELVKVWNKPKFARNSHYIITLDKIIERDEALLASLFQHEGMQAQMAEWRDLGILGNDAPDSPADLLAWIQQNKTDGTPLHPQLRFLPLDTRHVADRTLNILALFDDLDAALDGWIVHSENYQALNTVSQKFNGRVKTVYIDPPYNTGEDEFIYNDKYQFSSWLTMLENRLYFSRELLNQSGAIIVSIGREAVFELKQVLDMVFGSENQVGDLIWEKGRKNDANYFSLGHDYLLVYAKDEKHLASQKIVWREEKPGAHEILEEYRRLREIHQDDFSAIEQGIKNFYAGLPTGHLSLKHRRYNRVDKNGLWRDDNMSWPGGDGPSYDVVHPVTNKPCKVPDGGWRFASLEKFKLYESRGFIEYRKDHTEPPILKRYLNHVSTDFDLDSKRGKNTNGDEESESNLQVMPSVFYKNQQPPVLQLRHILGKNRKFKNPKDPDVLSRLFAYTANKKDIFVDFFAGSGTTAHAVINLNRTDNGKRKYLLVEMGDHFFYLILPRIKKIVFSDKWADGIANGGQGMSHFAKYYELEQYEDALRRARYEDDKTPLFAKSPDVYTSYVFMRDLKMLDAIDVDTANNNVAVHLDKLYDDIDLAETLSCLKGKWIKRITQDTVEFQDGTTASLSALDWNDVKPLIWW